MRTYDTARRRALARDIVVDIKPIGTALAKKLIAKRHGDIPLPQQGIFAFVANSGLLSETIVIVGEPDTWLNTVGCARKGNLQISNEWFENLIAATMQEASECQVEPPMSITLANMNGVMAFPFDANKKRRAS